MDLALGPEASTNSACVAVVGAGLAGLACARRLLESGVYCRVFESQRAPGGRIATRRFARASFDHGAQHLSPTRAEFRALLEAAQEAGAAGRWRPDWPGESSRELWVGVPSMSALPRFLAKDVDVEYGVHVTRLERSRGAWVLLDDRGAAHADFSEVVLALPAPAAAALAVGRTPLAARVRSVPMAPCWAVMVAFEEPIAGVPDAELSADATLAWFARDGSKPRRGARHAWVLHAAAEWSHAMLDRPAPLVQRALLERFCERAGRALPEAHLADAHCWRHARVESPLGEPYLIDADSGIGFCGDWCLAARAEAAWLSGTALGAALAEARASSGSGKLLGSR